MALGRATFSTVPNEATTKRNAIGHFSHTSAVDLHEDVTGVRKIFSCLRRADELGDGGVLDPRLSGPANKADQSGLELGLADDSNLVRAPWDPQIAFERGRTFSLRR